MNAAAAARPVAVANSRETSASSAEVTFDPMVVTLLSPQSPSAESIRAVRTDLLAQHIHAGRRALAVCAPNIDSGCTFLAVNLAVAMAQVGLQVLLVDADLRQPGVDSLIRPAAPVPGLSECLSSTEFQPGDFIQNNVLPGLSILYSGAQPPNPQELLARDRFEYLVNACLRDYDLTIFDTPPANTFADVRRVASVAGYALVVARRHKSLVPDVKTLTEQLKSDHARVIGTVMNA